MANVKMSVDLERKILVIEGNEFKLDNTLMGSSVTLQKQEKRKLDSRKVLSLEYEMTPGAETIYKEAAKIRGYLESKKLHGKSENGKIDVTISSALELPLLPLMGAAPELYLTGNLNINIKSN